MKRIIYTLFVFALLLSLTACFAYDGEIHQPTDNYIEDEFAASDKTDMSQDKNTDGKSDDEEISNKDITIEETVLLDEEGVKITAKSINMDAFFGPEIKVLIENNSGKDLTIQCRNSSVNGFMVGTMFSADVANGKKANEGITLTESDLKLCEITEIADVELSFHIFTTSDWNTYFDSEPILIKTSISDKYEYAYNDSGEVLYDANGIRIISKGLSKDDSFLGPCIVVYIENNSDKAFTVQAKNVSVNGFMVDAIFSCDIASGKKAIDSITFMNSDLEDNDITDIYDVELSFHVFDLNTWDTIVDTDIIAISFK